MFSDFFNICRKNIMGKVHFYSLPENTVLHLFICLKIRFSKKRKTKKNEVGIWISLAITKAEQFFA